MTEIIKSLESVGMQITNHRWGCGDIEIANAMIQTKNGIFEILVGSNGTAKLMKPNGSVKWVYDKSCCELRKIVKQIIDCNN